MNEYLAKQFVKYAQKHRDLEELQRIKIQYVCQVLLGETEKLLVLFALFALAGRTREFLLILLCLLTVRHYVGGVHFKTTFSCLMATIGICVLILYLGRYVLLEEQLRTVIYSGNMLLAYFFAPIPSVNRVSPSVTERWKTKGKGLFALGLMTVAGRLLGAVWEQYIVWAFLVMQVETVIAILLSVYIEKGGKKHEKCSSKSK